MGRFPKLPKSLYFSGIVAAHPRSSAKVSRESVEHGDCREVWSAGTIGNEY